jgi:hypothetical protein
MIDRLNLIRTNLNELQRRHQVIIPRPLADEVSSDSDGTMVPSDGGIEFEF